MRSARTKICMVVSCGDAALGLLAVNLFRGEESSHRDQGWVSSPPHLKRKIPKLRDRQRTRSGTRCVIATVTNYVRTKSDTKTKKERETI